MQAGTKEPRNTPIVAPGSIFFAALLNSWLKPFDRSRHDGVLGTSSAASTASASSRTTSES